MGRWIETFRGVVYPWQCDQQGHLNTMQYVGMFDAAFWHHVSPMGFTRWKARKDAFLARTAAYKRMIDNLNGRVRSYNRRYGGKTLSPDVYRYAKRLKRGLDREAANAKSRKTRLIREGRELDRQRNTLLSERSQLSSIYGRLKTDQGNLSKERAELIKMYKDIKKKEQ